MKDKCSMGNTERKGQKYFNACQVESGVNTCIKARLLFCKEIYITLLISHVMVSQILPLSVGLSEQIRRIAALILMGCGIGLILIQLLSDPAWFLNVNSKLLMIFYVVSILSCVINYKYGVIDNIKSLIWTCIHFFLLASFFSDVPSERTKQVCKHIFILPISIWSVTGIISIAQFVMGYSSLVYGSAQGWYFNRLFGVYKDPNFSSHASLCVIFICLYLFSQSRKRVCKLLYAFVSIIQILYVLLAYSRGAWLAGIGGCFVYLLVSDKHNNKQLLKRVCCSFVRLAGVLMIFVILRIATAFMVSQFWISADAKTNIQQNYEIQTLGEDNEESLTTNGQSFVKSILARTDLEGKDFSNGRVQLWKWAISVLRDKPLFGTSPQNIQVYYEEERPDVIAQRQRASYHNGYIAVIVGTGLFGAIFMAIFIGKNVMEFFKMYIFSRTNSADAGFAAIIVTMAAAACAVHEIFWINSVGTLFFWLFLGRLNAVYKVSKVEIQRDKKYQEVRD